MNQEQWAERPLVKGMSINKSFIFYSRKKLALPADRITYIDSARALLIILMIFVHATVPCQPEVRDALMRTSALGIATIGFTMLAGYTVAIRYGVGSQFQPSRLYRRALELIVVMFYSNLLITLAKLYTDSQLSSTVTLSWIIGLFTFQTPYNVSGVLLPIALQLPLFILIYKTECQFGRFIYVAWISVIIVLLSIGYQFRPIDPFLAEIMNLLIWRGVGGFPLILFVGYGIVGFATARLFLKYLTKLNDPSKIPHVFSAVVLSVFVILVVSYNTIDPLYSPSWSYVVDHYLKSVLLFFTILGFGGLLAQISPFPITYALSLLGRYALFAFIIHRIIGQAMIYLFDMNGGRYGVFLSQFTFMTVLTLAACSLRTRFHHIDLFLKKIYL